MTLQATELSTAIYTASLKDQDDVAIAASALTSLTLTLYNRADSAIINSRTGQNVLNANNVTVGSDGLLTWTMQPADNPIVDDTLKYESHIALFQWSWSGGSGKHAVTINVQNLSMVPTAASAGGTDTKGIEEIPMPDLTGDVTVDTVNSLLTERLRASRAGPLVTYRVGNQTFNWTQYLNDLDRRIAILRQEIAAANPVEEIGVCF